MLKAVFHSPWFNVYLEALAKPTSKLHKMAHSLLLNFGENISKFCKNPSVVTFSNGEPVKVSEKKQTAEQQLFVDCWKALLRQDMFAKIPSNAQKAMQRWFLVNLSGKTLLEQVAPLALEQGEYEILHLIALHPKCQRELQLLVLTNVYGKAFLGGLGEKDDEKLRKLFDEFIVNAEDSASEENNIEFWGPSSPLVMSTYS